MSQLNYCGHQKVVSAAKFLSKLRWIRRRSLNSALLISLIALATAGQKAQAETQNQSIVATGSTFVSEVAPDDNYAGREVLEISMIGVPRQALIVWDLSAIPEGALITSAKITLSGSYVLQLPDGAVYLSMHQVTSPWDESSVTWNDKPSVGEPVQSVPVSSEDPSRSYIYSSLELLSLVQEWHRGSRDNHGVYVLSDNSGLVGLHSSRILHLAPLLEVTYQLP